LNERQWLSQLFFKVLWLLPLFLFIFTLFSFIHLQSSSYSAFIHLHSPRLLSISSLLAAQREKLCGAEIRTRDCHTAGQRTIELRCTNFGLSCVKKILNKDLCLLLLNYLLLYIVFVKSFQSPSSEGLFRLSYKPQVTLKVVLESASDPENCSESRP
jgi:hypothetical protein